MADRFGAFQPAMDAVRNAPRNMLNTIEGLPGQAMEALGIPLGQPDAHQQAIDQMNQQAQAQRVQQATQSFQQPPVAPRVRIRMPQR